MSLTARLTGVGTPAACPSCHCAAEPINFQSVAALQIMVHRGGHLRWEAVAMKKAWKVTDKW
jgi:hypothetical protein